MSLKLLYNSLAVLPRVPVPFSASGGTAPYTYQVLPTSSPAGGVISNVGLYQAPVGYGADIIQVTDNVGNQDQRTIMIGNPLQLVCDIIKKEMALDDTQIYLYEQKINIPTDSRIYIAVGVLNAKPFANSNKDVSPGAGPGLGSVQSVNMMVNLTIDILSRSLEALNRKEEVLMALRSNYAQTQQELNSFLLGSLSNAFVNLSEVDGAAIPYRFNINVNMQYQITKTNTAVDYFDTFQQPSIVTDS